MLNLIIYLNYNLYPYILIYNSKFVNTSMTFGIFVGKVAQSANTRRGSSSTCATCTV